MPEFHARLAIELVDDLANDGQGEWEILRPLPFTDSEGVTHVVPAGYRSDLNSTPRVPIAYVLAGNRGHRACAIHDYLITSKTVTRDRADAIFLEALECIGIGEWMRGAMYRAVAAETRNIEARENPEPSDDYVG